MTESDAITCRICLEKIKQEVNFDLVSDSKVEVPSEEAISITENPVACDKCKIEVDEAYQLYALNESTDHVKDEIKEEVIEDSSISFNTDIPLCVEEGIPLNILYCYQCNYGTNDKENLTDHVFAHRFKCSQCSYTTPDNSILKIHQQCHFINGIDLPDEHECKYCSYKTSSRSSLIFHASACENRRKLLERVKSIQCDYTNTVPKYLNEHTRCKHGEHKLKHKCALYNTYTGKKLFECNHLKNCTNVPDIRKILGEWSIYLKEFD
ncbi:hypothetical protein FQR65_LT15751 [Abscondita terminalis]|nr:hypothetical protein FQR65_LT15751 [Abscondita terminalis]